MMAQKQEDPIEQSRNMENLPANEFTFDQIKMLWRQYAHAAKEKGLETMYHALIKRDPKLKDEHTFLLEVDNQVQIDYINPHLADMMNFIRKNIKNFHFAVEIILTKEEMAEVKLLNGKDRFNALSKSNPNLVTLKNVFNLDIEY